MLLEELLKDEVGVLFDLGELGVGATGSGRDLIDSVVEVPKARPVGVAFLFEEAPKFLFEFVEVIVIGLALDVVDGQRIWNGCFFAEQVFESDRDAEKESRIPQPLLDACVGGSGQGGTDDERHENFDSNGNLMDHARPPWFE
jgi:hypothetical protein